jgi:multicomponent Na+:H+ antiporter subunit D
MNKKDQQFIAQRIRTQYMEKEHSELDSLRELDAAVKRPANVFAYTFGSIGAVVMGTGMSLIMTELGKNLGISFAMPLGIVTGVIGMIMGSVNAIMQKDAKKMIAYSSISQVGYIYVGLGLGNLGGVIAAIFHIFMHGAVKSMLFISVGGLAEVSEEKTAWSKLTGAGYRNKMAGIAFTASAIAMIGIPLFGGFISKILFATAAVDNSMIKMVITLLALAVSTMLNAWYFFKAIICIYTPTGKREMAKRPTWVYVAVMVGFIMLNVFFGVFSDIVIEGIQSGLKMFV